MFSNVFSRSRFLKHFWQTWLEVRLYVDIVCEVWISHGWLVRWVRASCWGLLGVSLILVNLVVDHEFISEEYYLHWYEPFWESPKQSHESLESKWTISYHCGESWLLIWYQSHAVNLVMSIKSSNVEQRNYGPRRCSQKGRLFESSISSNFVRRDDCWGLLGVSHTLFVITKASIATSPRQLWDMLRESSTTITTNISKFEIAMGPWHDIIIGNCIKFVWMFIGDSRFKLHWLWRNELSIHVTKALEPFGFY